MGHEPSQSQSTHPWPEVNLLVAKKNDPKNADIREPYLRERVPGEVPSLSLVAMRENFVARQQHYGVGFFTEEEAALALGWAEEARSLAAAVEDLQAALDDARWDTAV
jgi:hypothetical protein